jgi:hypothetical protein
MEKLNLGYHTSSGLNRNITSQRSDLSRRFRDTHNKCFSQTIGQRDLTELAFAGLNPSLRDKLEGHNFAYVNQLLQRMLAQENRAKEHKSYTQFKETNSKEKPSVNYMKEDPVSDEDVRVCMAEWVDTTSGKPLALKR